MLQLLAALALVVAAGAWSATVLVGRVEDGTCERLSTVKFSCTGRVRSESLSLVMGGRDTVSFAVHEASDASHNATWQASTLITADGFSEVGSLKFPDGSALSYSGNGTSFAASKVSVSDAFLGAVTGGSGAFEGATGTLGYSELSPPDYQGWSMNFVYRFQHKKKSPTNFGNVRSAQQGGVHRPVGDPAPTLPRAAPAAAGTGPKFLTARFTGHCNMSSNGDYSCRTTAHTEHMSLRIPSQAAPSLDVEESHSGPAAVFVIEGKALGQGLFHETGAVHFGSSSSFSYSSSYCAAVLMGMRGEISSVSGIFAGYRGRAAAVVEGYGADGGVVLFVTATFV